MERRGLNEMRPSAHFRPLWAKENRKYFINERFPIYHDGKIIGYDEKRAGTTDDAPQELKDLSRNGRRYIRRTKRTRYKGPRTGFLLPNGCAIQGQKGL